MVMKKILVLLSILLVLTACVPQEPVAPVVDTSAAAQMGVQPVSAPLIQTAVKAETPEVKAPEVQASPSASEAPVLQSAKTLHTVIEKFAFAPEIRIKAGDTIVWTNKDSAPHDVASTSPEQRFQSSVLKQGKSFSMQFNQPGAYSYKCSLHPVMRGTIVVE